MLAVLFVAAVAGWRGYQWWQTKQAAESGAAFTSAVLLSEQGKHEEAEAAFSKVAKEGTASYRALAGMREAAELAVRDPKAAVVAYDGLANNRALGPVLQDLATLRAGYVLVDTAPFEEIRRRSSRRPRGSTLPRARAACCPHMCHVTSARHWFGLILADGETPAGIHTQAEILRHCWGLTAKVEEAKA